MLLFTALQSNHKLTSCEGLAGRVVSDERAASGVGLRGPSSGIGVFRLPLSTVVSAMADVFNKHHITLLSTTHQQYS